MTCDTLEESPRPDVPVAGGLECDYDDDARSRIASQVLAIVAEFAGDPTILDRAESGELEVPEGEALHHALERAVRSLAREAESTSRGGDVVCGVLAGRYLLDDYLRIVEVEQCYAFDHDLTAGELEDRHEHLVDVADRAAEAAVAAAEWKLKREQVCACGYDYGSHAPGRAATATRWGSPGSGPCRTFRRVDDEACRAVPFNVLCDAFKSWADRHGISTSDGQREEARRLLEEMRAGPKGLATRSRDAFVAVAACLNLDDAASTRASTDVRDSPSGDLPQRL